MTCPTIQSVHHSLSPSGAERWLHCTAAPALEAAFGATTSSYADEGTAAHALAADVLNVWQGAKPSGDAERCKSYVQADSGWAWPVLEYVEFVRGLPGKLYVEVRCSLDPWIPGGFGTADAVTWDADNRTLFVTDLKFGRGKRVDAQGNPQLRLYALGAAHTLGLAPDRIVMTIHQPRLDHVSQETLHFLDLQAWGSQIVRPAVLEVRQGGTYRPSESSCQWCRAKAVCAARAAVQLALAKEMFQS